jgi:hypothetical protein
MHASTGPELYAPRECLEICEECSFEVGIDTHRPVASDRSIVAVADELTELSCVQLERCDERRGLRARPRPPSHQEHVLRAVDPVVSVLVDALKKREGGQALRSMRRLHRMYLDYPTPTLVQVVDGVLRVYEVGLVAANTFGSANPNQNASWFQCDDLDSSACTTAALTDTVELTFPRDAHHRTAFSRKARSVGRA